MQALAQWRAFISSCQIFQAALIFKKWASQQTCAAWHGLLWGPVFITFCVCYISKGPFTHVGFAATHTSAEFVEIIMTHHVINDRKCRMALYLQHVPWLTLMSWVKLKALICRRPDMYSCISSHAWHACRQNGFMERRAWALAFGYFAICTRYAHA